MCHLCSLGEWPFVFWGSKMFHKITANIYLTINVSSLHKTHVSHVTLVYYDMGTFSLPTQSIDWGCICHKIESSAMLRIPHKFWHTYQEVLLPSVLVCAFFLFYAIFMPFLCTVCTLDHLYYLINDFNKWYVQCFSSLLYLQNQRSNSHSRDAKLPPRFSKKVFQSNSNVSAAGDPRAKLGSYSQAYGTISQSGLDNLRRNCH